MPFFIDKWKRTNDSENIRVNSRADKGIWSAILSPKVLEA
jgi:hypothetical protein